MADREETAGDRLVALMDRQAATPQDRVESAWPPEGWEVGMSPWGTSLVPPMEVVDALYVVRLADRLSRLPRVLASVEPLWDCGPLEHPTGHQVLWAEGILAAHVEAVEAWLSSSGSTI